MTERFGGLVVPGVRLPRQARGWHTFERILDTGAELLAEKGYDGLSVGELCVRAGVSLGALYGRIDSKDALVLAIHDRELARIATEHEIYLDTSHWDHLETSDLVREAVRQLGAHFSRHAALLRVFIHRASVDETLWSHGAFFASEIATRFTSLLNSRSADIPHPDPTIASDVAYRIAHAALSWRVAFGETFDSAATLPWESYVDQIAAAAQAYLMTAPSEPSRNGNGHPGVSGVPEPN